jgi:hypothetical protein
MHSGAGGAAPADIIVFLLESYQTLHPIFDFNLTNYCGDNREGGVIQPKEVWIMPLRISPGNDDSLSYKSYIDDWSSNWGIKRIGISMCFVTDNKCAT